MNGFLRLPDGRVINVANIAGVQARQTNGILGCVIEHLQGGRTILIDVPPDLVWSALADVAATASLTADAVLADRQTTAERGPAAVGT